MLRTGTILAVALATLFGLTASTAALAQGDAAKGSGLFARCTVCHSNAQNAPNRVGPNLFGVVGRKAGTVVGYNYSPAMKAAGFIWTQDALAKYLQSPSAVVPSNKMPFGGLSSGQQADDIAAYLATLK